MNKRRRERIEKRKALEAWSKEVRSVGACAFCGATERLQGAHLLPKERWPEYRTEIMNGLCLCDKCHKYAKMSFHQNPIWAAEKIRLLYPTKWAWVMSKC